MAAKMGLAPKMKPKEGEICLAGLSFTFTSMLLTLTLETGQALVKRHGGTVLDASTWGTSYVVLGSNAVRKSSSLSNITNS